MKKSIVTIAFAAIAVLAQQETAPTQPQQVAPPPPQEQQAYPPQQYQQQAYPPQYQQQPYPQQQYAYPPQQYQQGYPPPPYAYPQQPPQQDNYSTGQRWLTWGLNVLVPGLGSYIIMKDIFGGIVQDALYIGGFFMVMNSTYTEEECHYGLGAGNYCNEETHTRVPLFWGGFGAMGAAFIFNIIRSATHDKPVKTASIKNDGFNVAVLPNSRGKLLPYFLYSKAF